MNNLLNSGTLFVKNQFLIIINHMQKTYITVLMALIFASTQLTAQVKEFDLSTYQTSDYKRSSLDLNTQLRQGASDKSSLFDKQLDYKERQFSSNGQLKSTWDYIDFKRERIINYGSSVDLYGSYLHIQKDSIISAIKKNYSDGRIVFSVNGFYNYEQFYGNRLKNSWYINGDLNFAGRTDNTTTKNDSIIKKSSFQGDPLISSSIKIGHAHGRMEHVSVASEAIYILDDLEASGLLTRALTDNDVVKLADKINELKQERFFDERLYRMKVMEELIGFLKENSLIEAESVKVFNIISDYHFMAGIQTRTSGKRLYYDLSIKDTYFYYNNESSRTYNYNNVDGYFNIGFQANKPISLKWQRNFSSNISLSNLPILDAAANYSIGYYPNTRTYFSANTNVNLNLRYLSKQNYVLNNTFGLGVYGYYYLSEKMRLSASMSLYNAHVENALVIRAENIAKKIDNSIQQTFNLALTYYIF
ncbi:MAG: hypothetical protein JW735_13845 [Prolixibacteraceae bacterium]|nr:hypothetical protein [Prolixibacteraceae bacterium]